MTGYTCTARPCRLHPYTEIPKGDERWVRYPGSAIKTARHLDCVESPVIPSQLRGGRTIPESLLPQPGKAVPSLEEAPETRPEEDIEAATVYREERSMDGGQTWEYTRALTGGQVRAEIEIEIRRSTIKGNARRPFAIISRSSDKEHPVVYRWERWMDADELPFVKPTHSGAVFRYGGHLLAARSNRNATPPSWTVRRLDDPYEKWLTGGWLDLGEAVAAAVATLYGTPCTHGYVLGQDSCPGCDADNEDAQEANGARPPVRHHTHPALDPEYGVQVGGSYRVDAPDPEADAPDHQHHTAPVIVCQLWEHPDHTLTGIAAVRPDDGTLHTNDAPTFNVRTRHLTKTRS